ncbi:MAG: hypothetical protein RLZZ427_1042 [Pseudomonadota bacterium]
MPQDAGLDDASGEAELPLESVGEKLARLRHAAGLSRTDIAERTRIPERHLAAIEAGNFAALAGRTYAIGFTRSYAKALGLDDQVIAREVRAELAGGDGDGAVRGLPAFEPGDPARVPASRFAWLTALAAVAVIAVCLVFWRGYFAPGGTLPSILPPERPVAAAPVRVVPPAPVAVPTGGAVVFTAEQDRVWVKFNDGAGNQLLQKELALGESYTVPATAADVKLTTARPDALGITIGGQPAPKLSTQQTLVKDVPVSAVALLARGAPAVPETVAGTPVPAPAARPITRRAIARPVATPAAPVPADPAPAAT